MLCVLSSSNAWSTLCASSTIGWCYPSRNEDEIAREFKRVSESLTALAFLTYIIPINEAPVLQNDDIPIPKSTLHKH